MTMLTKPDATDGDTEVPESKRGEEREKDEEDTGENDERGETSIRANSPGDNSSVSFDSIRNSLLHLEPDGYNSDDSLAPTVNGDKGYQTPSEISDGEWEVMGKKGKVLRKRGIKTVQSLPTSSQTLNAGVTEKVEKRGRGRPTKKTAPKTSEKCPCNLTLNAGWIGCDNCPKWWHLSCVGLAGLTQDMVKSLENWSCPECFYSPHGRFSKLIKGNITLENESNSTDQNDCSKMRTMVKEELNVIQPVIKATVQHAVQSALSNMNVSHCPKDVVESAVKKYSEITAQSQQKVIEQNALKHTTKAVAEAVTQKMDSDKIVREQRKCNVVVMRVPESKATSSTERRDDDSNFCYEELGMNKDSVKRCYRTGKLDASKPGYCRPLVIELKTKGDVDYWTNDGKGFKTESGFWVNQDLCEADRKANFLMRQQRRERMKKTQTLHQNRS